MSLISNPFCKLELPANTNSILRLLVALMVCALGHLICLPMLLPIISFSSSSFARPKKINKLGALE
jgi:hypothetical protein